MKDKLTLKNRTISPSLLKTVSTTRTQSRLSNFEHTRKKIANISKTVFKTDIDQHPILTLEKAVLRGRGTEDNERKPTKSTKKRYTTELELYLKGEHKIKDNKTQIIKLPKLPYGNHIAYNEEDSKFVDKHFVTEKSMPEQKKELDNLSQKFRLKERTKSKRNHSLNSTFYKKNDDKQIYFMESGQLVVAKENDVIESYETDKAKYTIKHHYVYQTFRNVELNYDANLSRKSTFKKLLQADELLQRLYKSPKKENTSELSRELTTKYSMLFTK